MVSNARVSALRLEFEFNERQLQQAKRSIRRMQSDLDNLNRVQAQQAAVARAASGASERAATEYNATAADARQAANEILRLSDVTRRANDQFDDVSRSVGLAGDVQSNLGAVSGLLGAAGAGGAAQGVAGIGEVVALIEELPRLKAAAGGLPGTVKAAAAALGPAGFALGGVIVALGVAAAVAARAINKGKQAFEDTLDAVTRFNRAALDLTTDEARAELESLEKDLDATTKTLEDLEAAGEGATGILGAVIKKFGGYSNAIEELEREQAALNSEIGLYERALENNLFAVNDNALATERLAQEEKELAEARQNQLDALVETRRQVLESVIDPTFTGDELQNRIDALTREQASINQVVRQYDLSEAALAEYQNRLEDIQAQLDILNTFGAENARINDERIAQEAAAATAAERFKEGLQAVKDRAMEGLKALRESAERIRKVNEDIADIRRKTAQRVQDIERDRARKEADALRTREQAIAEAQRAAEIARVEAVRENAQELADLERDLADDRESILKRSRRDLNDAIAERDALAAFQAEQARDNELSALEKDGERRLKEIDRQYREQNRAIDQRLREQTRTAVQRYNEQLRTARLAAQRQIADARRAAQQEIAIKRQSISAQNQVLAAGANQSVQITARQVSGINAQLSQLGRSFVSNLRTSFRPTTMNVSIQQAQTRTFANRREIDRRLNATLTRATRGGR